MTDHTGALRLDNSMKLLARGRLVDATLSEKDYVIERDRLVEGAYPVYGERARGARVWDADGNEYLDYILAYGTIILGHADPAVTKAAQQEIEEGFSITLRKRTHIELAERLVRIIPGAERVFLLKTGSDATSAAVRLARAYTGRDRVVRWGYNGWHDWAAQRPGGIPDTVRTQVDTFRYNDLDDLREVFRRHAGQVACLLLMPFELDSPEPGFLQGAIDLAHEHGALVVFDEMRSGFRVALGGAQELYGVRADLATFSKAMANGWAVSALTGRADVMAMVGQTHISSTFYSNSVSMAAAVATIDQLADGTVLDRVRRLGVRLQSGLTELVGRHGVPARVRGVPQMPFLAFTHPDPGRSRAMQDAFFAETTRRGVLLHPTHHWFVCAATTDADLDHTLAACDAAFEVAAKVA
ncbi:aspartate aminotransferase family protein [Streptomyces hygroscopicus]|uniref:Glutamate-1-semialdehyde 2,1-aminomutase n=1 Tax=Streptomyces hygroscopicus TaxID=1912 RepID=A0ABQ3U2G2_STRHY|nr:MULTISPECIES: aminotransferase class III-fold pyridoxal phosphate-dependent enzyme [Streptomyces]MBW8086521.1 aminotransferase class III-fold pyridoxal phosphate-dependent enzyme [Streptomyces hygroscopicus subsp. hygroscopicus]GHJ29769.1 glutamate-1-semialdehyde 2,1-aminomutase [Streptomyces hygroscopicus]